MPEKDDNSPEKIDTPTLSSVLTLYRWSIEGLDNFEKGFQPTQFALVHTTPMMFTGPRHCGLQVSFSKKSELLQSIDQITAANAMRNRPRNFGSTKMFRAKCCVVYSSAIQS